MMKHFVIIAQFICFCTLAHADPAGIFLQAYSPEAPAEKIECFEFKRMQKEQLGTRVYLDDGRSFVVNDYRNRGWIPYVIGLSPGQPEFEKQLKLYEDKAKTIPSTRQFLNPRIELMRNQLAEFVKRNAEIAKLPSIILLDGTELRGCVLTKIENGMASIKHADGFRSIKVSDLGDKDKSALSKTSDTWSLEEPYISAKDASGIHAQIVLRNSRVIKNVRFKEFVDGVLVFTDGSNDYPVPLDMLPEKRLLLGSDVVKLFEPDKKPAESQRDFEMPIKEAKKTESVSEIRPIENEDPAEQYRLGLSYAHGEGRPKDMAQAIVLWKKAAEQGYAKAQMSLGYCYEVGDGVKVDSAQSVLWNRKAAEQGEVEAQTALGRCYSEGKGVVKDTAKAVSWWKKAAEQGGANAQCFLAISYEEGIGVTQNFQEAVKWYRKAADQGIAVAQSNLGGCYTRGDGVSQNDADALTWYRKAAEQGYAIAQTQIGIAYLEGKGCAKDETEAFMWFRQAADQNNPEAQFFVGFALAEGRGVTKNEASAAEWLIKSAKQGVPEAQALLGEFYAQGRGVKKNDAEAAKWYQMAAEQGYQTEQTSSNFGSNRNLNQKSLVAFLQKNAVYVIAGFAIIIIALSLILKKLRKILSAKRKNSAVVNSQKIKSTLTSVVAENDTNQKDDRKSDLIKFFCSHCNAKISAPISDAGISSKCPVCRQQLSVPEKDIHLDNYSVQEKVKLPPVPGYDYKPDVPKLPPKNKISIKNKILIIAIVILATFIILRKNTSEDLSVPKIEEKSSKEKIEPHLFDAYMYGYNDPMRAEAVKALLNAGPSYPSEDDKAIAMFVIMGAEDRINRIPVRFSPY